MFCRVRPAIKEDGSGPQAETVVSYDTEDDSLVNVMYKTRQQTFEVDKVFNADISQEEVSFIFKVCLTLFSIQFNARFFFLPWIWKFFLPLICKLLVSHTSW